MLIQVEKDLPDMKHIKAVAGYILILSLCLVCAHPAHAETRRIALIHSFEPGYPPAAKALELLQREFSLLGLDCDVREYYLDCDRYMEEAENLRMAGFVGDLSAWGAELIAVLDDQAAYALMACRHPLAHEIPVVFSGVNYPNISLLLQYPNITGYADTPDYLRTIRMIESIMGKSRICLMNGQVFLDRKIWHALNEQCRGQGFAIVTSTEGAYFAGSSYHCVREGDYQPYTETAEHRRVAGHHEDCAHDERLHSDTPSDVVGTRRQYVAALHQARLYHQTCGHALRQSHVSDH